MSAHEIEAAIIRLTPQELVGLLSWLEAYHAQVDQQAFEYEQEYDPFDPESPQPADLHATID